MRIQYLIFLFVTGTAAYGNNLVTDPPVTLPVAQVGQTDVKISIAGLQVGSDPLLLERVAIDLALSPGIDLGDFSMELNGAPVGTPQCTSQTTCAFEQIDKNLGANSSQTLTFLANIATDSAVGTVQGNIPISGIVVQDLNTGNVFSLPASAPVSLQNLTIENPTSSTPEPGTAIPAAFVALAIFLGGRPKNPKK